VKCDRTDGRGLWAATGLLLDLFNPPAERQNSFAAAYDAT
jgi:hypothetical protein